MKRIQLLFLLMIIYTYELHAITGNVVLNGGFEKTLDDGSRPQYWQIGFSDDPESYLTRGKWSLDSAVKQEGDFSLKLEPASKQGFLVSQILHAPVYDLTGKKVHISADIRHEGMTGTAVIMVLAVNPTLPPDPEIGAGLAGKAIFGATGPPGEFQTYEAEFTATAPAAYLFIVCSVDGLTGAAWFDRIIVETDCYQPGPDPEPVTSPIQTRNFKLGFVQENPIDLSEAAMEMVIDKTASAAEVINLFFHVRWCKLTGESITWGHKMQLRQAQLARQAGLKIALTFDFTHNVPDQVGDINPKPDGTSVGKLSSPSVSGAYQWELLDLCEKIRPEYVIVGVETDIFHDKHPDQWPAYVAMFKAIADTLTSRYPGIHVTAYFTLPWMVSPDGTIDQNHAAIWRQLQPQLASVAYSIYPEVLGLTGVTLTPGYFIKARDIAPELPVMLPEFGVPGGPGAILDYDEQAQLLVRIFSELAQAPVELAVWFSMYDQTYLGVPDDFRRAFSCLGMHRLDGTAKKAWALWRAVYQNAASVENRHPVFDSPVKDFQLYANYPNPFNPVTFISYDLEDGGLVTLAVYDMTGRLVRNLAWEYQSAGNHIVQWDGTDECGTPVASGIYVYRLGTPQRYESRKMILMR
jgi:hypothetical protein